MSFLKFDADKAFYLDRKEFNDNSKIRGGIALMPSSIDGGGVQRLVVSQPHLQSSSSFPKTMRVC